MSNESIPHPQENHLYHGDALEILPTFPDASFDAIVTDPPYCSGGLTASERARPASVKYVQSRQKTVWPDFESESMDQNAWAQWTYRWLKECKRVAKDGAPIAIFIDWRQLPMLTTLLPGFELLSWRSFVLGLVESFAWGWYVALIFGPLYNFFALRWP